MVGGDRNLFVRKGGASQKRLGNTDSEEPKHVVFKISDFTPCAHAQSDILHMKYTEKTMIRVQCLGKCVRLGFGLEIEK